MSFQGFTEKDFHVFQIEGLDNRMNALISEIRPKLEFLGKYFSPILSSLVGEEMFAHVAKHARRTVNPPNDTWVAFAPNPRGYKMVPHFQIGLWETHVFVWYALIYEATMKKEIGKKMEQHLDEIYTTIPKHFVWSLDHTKPDAFKHQELSKDDLLKMFVRLQQVKKAEILCGIHLPQNEVINMSGEQLLNTFESTFKTLIPLYKLS